MQRLSLAELKAKANVIKNAEIITGGQEAGCHPKKDDTNNYDGILPDEPVKKTNKA